MVLRPGQWDDMCFAFKEWWRNLRLRIWINENPKLVWGITGVSCMLAVIGVIWAYGGGEKERQIDHGRKVWCYDLNTKELFSGRSKVVPPFETTSGATADGGAAGVRAHVFRYGYGEDAEEVIGYLEKAEDGMSREDYERVRSAVGEEWGKGLFVRLEEGEKWFAADRAEGRAIIEGANRVDKQGWQPVECFPD